MCGSSGGCSTICTGRVIAHFDGQAGSDPRGASCTFTSDTGSCAASCPNCTDYPLICCPFYPIYCCVCGP
jgi:hypothetical protein